MHLLGAGDEVVVWDDDPAPVMATAAAAAGASLLPTPIGGDLGSEVAAFDLVVPSPGVPAGHPVLSAAAALGVTVRSEIDLAFDLPDAARPEILAVTGTNGKTTVTTLATAMLNRSGINAVAAGNIGLPLIDAVRRDVSVVVAEVSSFQLQFTLLFHPYVSCWLNLAEDHLDWHPSMEHYAQAKAQVWARQAPGDVAVVNADDRTVASASLKVPRGVECVRYSTEGPADYAVSNGLLIGRDGEVIARTSELPRSFPHDVSNSLAATAIAVAAGARTAACREALRETEPLPHRLALLGESDGVRWYEDSKATTPASVRAAAAGFESLVLIAGGRNKGLDLSVLAALAPPVHAVVAIGEAAGEVAAAFAGVVPVTEASTMEAAVEAAAAAARPGDAVVLSPGCASFDWYQSYGERGDHFAAIVRALLEREERGC
jgi:UDP-N-acetylmuramoylalanine--D-glutamate ligase